MVLRANMVIVRGCLLVEVGGCGVEKEGTESDCLEV